ncbi:MAG: CinA family protein [Marmoricola sp.]
MEEPHPRLHELVDQIAALAQSRSLTVGVAESLTGGQISAALAGGDRAADWFRGAVVAYAAQVKFDVLQVDPGPVNTGSCASQMALGAHRVLDCDVAVSATGVGGPGPDEGTPAGTVFVASSRRGRAVEVDEHHLEGEPEAVVEGTVALALGALLEVLEDQR